MAQESGVPHPQEAHQKGDVLPRRLVAEVVVHVVRPIQEATCDVEAVVQSDWKNAHSGANAISVEGYRNGHTHTHTHDTFRTHLTNMHVHTQNH